MKRWQVLADGKLLMEFSCLADAEDFAASWNSVYPHKPWFKVAEVGLGEGTG